MTVKRDRERDPKAYHVLVYALLSLTSYLVAFILSITLGAPGPLPFVIGGAALIFTLALEAGFRGRLWIFEPVFSEAFGHPQIAHRLTYFSVGLLLILETSIILGYFLLR